jgi:hypothetical protein
MLCTKQLLGAPIKLEELERYMLYGLTNANVASVANIANDEISVTTTSANSANSANSATYNKKYQMSIVPNIPLSRVKIDYSKKYSKYNEPFKITSHKNFKDKLFWLFYKLINNFDDSDLETLNSFTIMKDFKFGVVEKLRSQKNTLKHFKISKSFVEDDLTNNEKISFKTFHALCVLHLINVIILRSNNSYCVLCCNNDEKVYNLQNYKVLQLSNEKMSALFNNFDVKLLNGSISEEELQTYLVTYFHIENIEKPLKAFSSYKLDDLTKIAEQLSITIYDENGKKRKKQDLYEKIVQKVA